MKLSYRGTTYEVAPTVVELVENEAIGRYRGVTHRLSATPRFGTPQSVLTMSYRGAKYIGLH